MQFTQKISLEFLPEESREFLQLFRDCKKLLNENKNSLPPHKEVEFGNDLKARCILSGNPNKPISKKVFNRLRAEGKIITYYPSQGRTVYKIDELYAYIESTIQKPENI